MGVQIPVFLVKAIVGARGNFCYSFSLAIIGEERERYEMVFSENQKVNCGYIDE